MSIEIEQKSRYKASVDKSAFKEILKQQESYKEKFAKIKMHHIDTCILTMVIKNNEIKEILQSHRGFFYPKRKENYIKLISDTLNKYTIKDGIININIGDLPKEGMFNFCREKNKNFFLLPNFRFLNDDVIISENKTFNTFEEQTVYLNELSKYHDYNSKINKVYFSGGVSKKVRQEFYDKCISNPEKYKGVLYCEEDNTKKMTQELKEYYIQNNILYNFFVPFKESLNYKYVLYLDSGHSISDRMRLLLATNSLVIKKNSDYEEFYYYLLKDKHNYYSFNNINELDDLYEELENRIPIEQQTQIIKNNNTFVKDILNYNNILEYTANILNIVL